MESLQTLFTIPGLAFSSLIPSQKSSDDVDGTILFMRSRGATVALRLTHRPSQLCLATRQVGSPVT